VTGLLLVRHGQSEWNAIGRWQGQADAPLSDLGREQARRAAPCIGAVDAIVASDLSRAVETAAIISSEIGVGPVVTDPDLRERDAGEWSGLTRAEIDERWPGYLADPKVTGMAPGQQRRPPGWEPDEALLARAMAAIHRINALAPGGDVLAVTHGGLVYAVERELGAPMARLANLEGRWLTVDGDNLCLGERVLLVGDDTPVTVPNQL
jgi:probable phosphoglycerate mutase